MFLISLLAACSGRDDGPPPGGPPDGTDPLADGFPQGEYLLSLALAPVGGLPVPLKIDVETRETADGPVFTALALQAVASDGETVSDVLATLTDVPVSTDGFDVAVPEFVMPAEFSITGSEVSVLATLHAESVGPDGFCGSVSGSLPTFSLPLDGSTFGSIPWDRRAEGAPTSCATGTIEEVPRITDCPAVVDGLNLGFPSGSVPREFELVLPTRYDPATDWPLVLVYHGFGGDIAGMLDGTDLRRHADDLGVVLVVPQALVEGDQTLWDAFSDPRTNRDAVLFDDLVTCVQDAFSIDPDRIHVTGMSNGGLMTGYLVATRSGVLASAAPLSGGITTIFEDQGHAMPTLVVWGGETDVAYDQDFHVLAGDMIDTLVAEGWFVTACDHGLGHTLDPSFWPWVLQFLLDHPYGVAPEPYATTLPPAFPGYCAIR